MGIVLRVVNKKPTRCFYLAIHRITYLLRGHSPAWEAKRFSASQEIPRFLRKPKIQYCIHTCPSLSLSGARSIQSTPRHTPSRRSILILSSIYVWVFRMVSFSQVSPPKSCRHHSSPPHALHAMPISFFPVQSPEQYWARRFQYSDVVVWLLRSHDPERYAGGSLWYW
jgi:hypothetical protein